MRYLLFTAEKKFRPGSSSYGWGFLLGCFFFAMSGGGFDNNFDIAATPARHAANFDSWTNSPVSYSTPECRLRATHHGSTFVISDKRVCDMHLSVSRRR
ncbi:hypothetical protein HKX24_02595 [Sulfitobacter sp. M85]|nr:MULTISPECIES: hypothetical protein [unclassified Sulfitobacter]MDF3381943.1 hypothetical protein [Sulfitobacter sp. Ks11]MDF3385362.1 hypothetical protein [Sulfitobacter sp. M85]MDF3388781.1 hypothetical protein [Sulfitobacter sp. Ks16]MDF3399418.1 hypothetical protein [Sulfitobacter sp. KE39]MDF3402839.1 hypothetical protein [Sulfitobacter sp. Ks35]